MMDPSDHPAGGGKQHPSPDLEADDDTVVTPTRGERTQRKDKVCVEKTLKFRFVPSTKKDNVHPAILHAHWMHEVITAFGGNSVQFFDNRNRQVTKIEPLRTDPEVYTQQFHLHHDRHTSFGKEKVSNKQDFRKVTSYIVHRIRSSVTLSEIKANAKIFKLMKDHDFYVNEHRWSEADWETTQLGFLYGVDPQFYNIDQATTKFTNTLRQVSPRAKIPKFRLVYCSPKIKTAKGRMVRTKAYAVETMRADRDELNKLLKAAYKDDGTFVPFQLRARHPDAFERFVKAQTQMLATNYVILLNHIGPDAMHYLSDRILAISGVVALLPSISVNEDGRYKVLVHQKNYHKVRDYLKQAIPEWYEEHVEPDAKAPEYRYPGPPEVSPIESDGISQGDQTYLSISINTAMSISSNISNDSPPSFIYPKDHQSATDDSTLGGSQANSSIIGKTWADKVRGFRTYSSSEPPSTVESESQRALQQELATSREEVAALKARLATIENAQLQGQALAINRGEVAELKEKVAHMENERAKERELIEEKVQQQVAQVLQTQFRSFAQEMTVMFSQMMTLQQQSPQNQTLTLFQQQNPTNQNTVAQQQSPRIQTKRSASNSIDGIKDTGHTQQPREETTKRRDSKNTPVKKPQSSNQSPTSRDEWSTPQYLQQIATQQDWTESPNSHLVRSSGKNTLNDGEINTAGKSTSEDEDSDMHGSGTESINKSLEYQMEAEASTNDNE